ncbi:unnamed protein product [Ixodes persulcatus]
MMTALRLAAAQAKRPSWCVLKGGGGKEASLMFVFFFFSRFQSVSYPVHVAACGRLREPTTTRRRRRLAGGFLSSCVLLAAGVRSRGGEYTCCSFVHLAGTRPARSYVHPWCV